MKFLHAADIHLDSPLTGLANHPDIPEHITRHCTRRAFANMIDLAISEEVAFIIIAGDLYDGDWRDYSTGLFFAGEMRRLGRPCFLIRGNHDAHSLITRNLRLPDNVREFASSGAVTFEAFGVALHGQSFPDRAVPEDLSQKYPAAKPGVLNIGILHTSAEDPGPHDPYAPCRIDSLAAKSYQYWALGHIHNRNELRTDPWIVFPGNLQGRHINEPGRKGCTIVEFEADRIVSVQHRDCDVLRWGRLIIPVDGADTIAEITARLPLEFGPVLDQADGLPLIVRVTLTGVTPCHGELLASPAQIDAECRNAAAAVSGNLFIERVKLETRPPSAPLLEEGALAELERAFHAALDDPAVQQKLLRDCASLAGQMPASKNPDRISLPLAAETLHAFAPDAWALVARTIAQLGS